MLTESQISNSLPITISGKFLTQSSLLNVLRARCSRLHAVSSRTRVHRPHIRHGDRQDLPGMGRADSARTWVQQRLHVSRRKRDRRQQLLSQSGKRLYWTLVLH